MWLLVILGLLALAAIIVITVYNRLVALRQACNQGLANIDVQLKQRHDAIPNLVETVKGYAAHERETLDAVIAARSAAMAADGVGARAQAEAGLGAALGKLLALGEAYPDLKASENFVRLQADIADIEDKLSAARRALNSAVASFNAAIEAFPAILFARSLGFLHRDFWDLEPGDPASLGPPEVRFS